MAFLSAGCEKPQYTADELAKMPLAKREGLPEPSGGFALVVGDQTVTTAEVIGPVFEDLAKVAQNGDFPRFRQIAQPVIEKQFADRIVEAVLYSRAKKEAGENIDDELDRAVTAEVRRFVMNFGGDYARAEQELKKRGMDWGRYEQYQRRMILSHSYVAQQIQNDQPITYNEMLAVYNETKDKFTTPAVLQFRLIDIEPAKIKNIDANLPLNWQAKDLAEKIVALIKQGQDFEQLARDFSHDHMAQAGGLWRKLDPEALAAPYDILPKLAQTMKPGDIAGPVEAQNHIFIMQLVSYQPKAVVPFDKVQNQLKAEITRKRSGEAFDKLEAELSQQASTADKTRFVDFCVHEIYRMANK